jgi:hypothetical protein
MDSELSLGKSRNIGTDKIAKEISLLSNGYALDAASVALSLSSTPDRRIIPTVARKAAAFAMEPSATMQSLSLYVNDDE